MPNVFGNLDHLEGPGGNYAPVIGHPMDIGVAERNKLNLDFRYWDAATGQYSTIVIPLAREDGKLVEWSVTDDLGAAATTGRYEDLHRFKVPQLRQVSKLGPYFHDNSAETLEDAVDYFNSDDYNRSPDGRRLSDPPEPLGASCASRVPPHPVTSAARVATLEIVAEEAFYSIAYADDVCLFVPRAPPQPEMTGALQRAVETLHTRTNRRAGLFLLVPADAPSPAGGDRESATRHFRAMQSDLALCAAVLEGSGFVAAAKRSLVLHILGGMLGKMPVKVFGELRDAATWLSQEARPREVRAPEAFDLMRFARRLRDRISLDG